MKQTTNKETWETKRIAIWVENQIIVDSGKCPICGTELRRNNSMHGWWQCAQLGAVNFRRDPSKPSCSWEGFVK